MQENFNSKTVKKEEIVKSVKETGVKSTDTIIVHSSLKSFGIVEGGADTVIDVLKDCVKEGTLCFPSLQYGRKAYENWNINITTADTGLISEIFRKQSGVLRSDQATHSVTAFGKNAEFITKGHCDGRGRVGIYGSTPFSWSSPWQKIYDLNGKVVLLGVTMVYNTFKHFVEYCFVDDTLSMLTGSERQEAEMKLSCWSDCTHFSPIDRNDESIKPDGVWLWNDGLLEQQEMEKLGLLNQSKCGNAIITTFKVKDFYNFLYNEFRYNPEKWLRKEAIMWIKKYRRN